jgi:hypothetical protein
LRLREKLFWLCALAGLIVLVLSLVPSHYEICKETKEAQQESCAPYQVVPFVAIKVIQTLDKLGGVITALATIAIAIFTLTLKRATDKLWDAGEKQLAHAQSEAEAADFHRSAQFEQISEQIEALKQSAVAAEENVFETRRLVQNAEAIAERQLRAYVHVADAKIDHDNDEWQPNIRITIKNYGQTPARRVNHKADTELPMIGPGRFDLRDEPRLSDLGPTQEVTKSIIVSHGFWHKTVRPSVANKAVKYYVFGKITYNDIFSATVRTTEYRFELDIDDAGGCGLSFCEEGNRSD